RVVFLTRAGARGYQPSLEERLSRSSALLLPVIDKDFPAFYAFQFQDAVFSPRVVFQFLSNFVFVFSIEDQQRAAFIDQRAAHQNKTVVNELIDELRMLVPKRLLACALGEITIGTG